MRCQSLLQPTSCCGLYFYAAQTYILSNKYPWTAIATVILDTEPPHQSPVPKEYRYPMSKLEDKIVGWQMKVGAGDEDDVSGDVIALLYSSVISCLQAVVGDTRKQIPESPYYSSLEKSAAALVLWGADHRVRHGALDRNLQRSAVLQEIVLQILLSIGDALARCKCAHVFTSISL